MVHAAIAIPTVSVRAVDTGAVTCAACAGTGTNADWTACCARCAGRGTAEAAPRLLVVRAYTAGLRVALAILRDQAESARGELAMFQHHADRAALVRDGHPGMFDNLSPARGAA